MYLAALKTECMKRNKLSIFFLLVIGLYSCRNDDDGLLDAEVVPPRLLSEVAAEDETELNEYLSTHFYNYEDFENPSDDFDFNIVIDTIAGDNSSKRPLIDDVQSEIILVSSDNFSGLEEENDVPHKLYYLEVRPGEGESPTIGDNAIISYEGSYLDGNLFDSSIPPLSLYLSGTVRGFGQGITKFKSGGEIVDNGDGTVDFGTYGIGVIFMPSGLGYGNGRGPSGTIPAYSPLVFKVDSFSFVENTDFDGDGIPSILEDLNGDGDLNNDNTDEDTEPLGIYLANHNDSDDDADGIPTIDEIELDADGNFVGFRDTDGDGIHDHLDNDN